MRPPAPQRLHSRRPSKRSASVQFRSVFRSTLVGASSRCQTSLQYSGHAGTFVPSLWTQSANKTVEGWPVKFSAFPEKIQQHGFCAPKPEETTQFNQQDFLKEYLLHSNQGAPARTLVGSIVGCAVQRTSRYFPANPADPLVGRKLTHNCVHY